MKHYLLILTISIPLLLTGCVKQPDAAAYTQSLMDALYKASYTDYAEMLGQTTTGISNSRSQWLDMETDRFLELTGCTDPSDDMRSRVSGFISQACAAASYETATGDTSDQVVLTIKPMTIITDQYDSIVAQAKTVNDANKDYEYAEMSEQDYYDSYLSPVMTNLESQLSQMSYGDTVTLDITLVQDEDGLYFISDEDLQTIEDTVLPMTR